MKDQLDKDIEKIKLRKLNEEGRYIYSHLIKCHEIEKDGERYFTLNKKGNFSYKTLLFNIDEQDMIYVYRHEIWLNFLKTFNRKHDELKSMVYDIYYNYFKNERSNR